MAGAAAYANSVSVPLLFDDETSIATNESVRHWVAALWPPTGTTVSGRPLLNLSLALNYSISGTAVWSYHAVNVAIHVLAGLTLFGVVRRTLAPRSCARTASLTAFSVALLWTVHPLQTESVTYIIQRAESLMGLLYLLTLYCFIRGAEREPAFARRSALQASEGGEDKMGARRAWFALSVLACLLGMATKEVMVSAPLIVLLYDRTFFTCSFRKALRRRWGVYVGLGATWGALLLLVLSTHGRGGTAGFASRISPVSYAITQFPAVVHYLRLCVWPHPLIFSYGATLAPGLGQIVPSVLVVALLLAASAWALIHRPAVGFLGISFFAILAPTSSIVPIATETMAEQRMYLPLISVVVLVVIGIHRWLGRGALPCCLLLAAALLGTTWQRNKDYSDLLKLWGDTVAGVPHNFYAHYNYGSELGKIPGRSKDSIAQFEEALRLDPDSVEARFYLACELQNEPGRLSDAIAQYEEALRLDPDYYQAHTNLGNVMAAQGRAPEAIAHYESALRLRPDMAEIHFNLAVVLLGTPGGTREAVEHLKAALQLQPDNERVRKMLAGITGPQPQ